MNESLVRVTACVSNAWSADYLARVLWNLEFGQATLLLPTSKGANLLWGSALTEAECLRLEVGESPSPSSSLEGPLDDMRKMMNEKAATSNILREGSDESCMLFVAPNPWSRVARYLSSKVAIHTHQSLRGIMEKAQASFLNLSESDRIFLAIPPHSIVSLVEIALNGLQVGASFAFHAPQEEESGLRSWRKLLSMANAQQDVTVLALSLSVAKDLMVCFQNSTPAQQKKSTQALQKVRLCLIEHDELPDNVQELEHMRSALYFFNSVMTVEPSKKNKTLVAEAIALPETGTLFLGHEIIEISAAAELPYVARTDSFVPGDLVPKPTFFRETATAVSPMIKMSGESYYRQVLVDSKANFLFKGYAQRDRATREVFDKLGNFCTTISAYEQEETQQATGEFAIWQITGNVYDAINPRISNNDLLRHFLPLDVMKKMPLWWHRVVPMRGKRWKNFHASKRNWKHRW